MIKQLLAWARTPTPATFQARRLQSIGSGAWFPSTKTIMGCGVNKLPSHHYGYAYQVFSWYDENMQNRLRLPHIIVGQLTSGFYNMTDDAGAIGAPVDGHRICVFNSAEKIDEHREMLVFFHEAAHTFWLLHHDRYFLAMHLMLNYRSGVNFSEQEVDFDYCTSQDFNILSAADWALDYASKNYQNDEDALTLAMNLLILRDVEFKKLNEEATAQAVASLICF